MFLKSRSNEEEAVSGRADASCSEMCIAPHSVGIVVGMSVTGESESLDADDGNEIRLD